MADPLSVCDCYTPVVDVVFSSSVLSLERAGVPGSDHHRQPSGRSQDKATLFLYLAQVTDQSEPSILTTDQSEERSVVSEQQPRSVYNQLLNCQSREFYFSGSCDLHLE